MTKSIAIICGGSTTQKYLSKSSRANLYINGFDNGKSTGLLRMIYPNTLGWSDFRKNASQIVKIEGNIECASILEKRVLTNEVSEYLNQLQGSAEVLFNTDIYNHLKSVVDKIGYIYNTPIALGNIIFAAAQLFYNSTNVLLSQFNKNRNIKLFSVSGDDNFYLYGLGKDGNFYREEEIVAPNPTTEITDVRFSTTQARELNFISPSLINRIQLHEKEIIISPGTFFSSTYPSLYFVDVSNESELFMVPNSGSDWDNPMLTADEMHAMCEDRLGKIKLISDQDFKNKLQ